jgi:TPR repeat protein
VREAVETLVESGELDDDTSAAWLDKKRAMDLKQAQKLYDSDRVLDAAKLGLPKAQARMAERYYHGTFGVEKDLDKSFEWATKAAEGGDKKGQYLMGYAYDQGEGAEQNWVEALRWYQLAAAQGSETSMNNIGCIHEVGGFGVPQNLELALHWFRKAADADDQEASYDVGNCYYRGVGVTKDLFAARTWYQTASSRGDVEGKFKYGLMMVRGEGGSAEFGAGINLIEAAASEGCTQAAETLLKLTQAAASVDI